MFIEPILDFISFLIFSDEITTMQSSGAGELSPLL